MLTKSAINCTVPSISIPLLFVLLSVVVAAKIILLLLAAFTDAIFLLQDTIDAPTSLNDCQSITFSIFIIPFITVFNTATLPILIANSINSSLLPPFAIFRVIPP